MQGRQPDMAGTLVEDIGLGLLRNALMAAGAALVTQGVISSAALTDAVGAILVIAGVVLSAISNRTKAQATAVVQAVNDHPSLTLVPAAHTANGKPAIIVKVPFADQPVPQSLV